MVASVTREDMVGSWRGHWWPVSPPFCYLPIPCAFLPSPLYQYSLLFMSLISLQACHYPKAFPLPCFALTFILLFISHPLKTDSHSTHLRVGLKCSYPTSTSNFLPKGRVRESLPEGVWFTKNMLERSGCTSYSLGVWPSIKTVSCSHPHM